MAIRSWRRFGRSGTSPEREVPVAARDAGAATERRGSGDRRAPSPVGPRCAPVLTGLRPSGLSIIKSRAEPSRAEPSRAEPSRAEPSRAEPSRAEPSRAEPSRAEPQPSDAASLALAGAPPPDLTHRPRPPGRGTPTLPGLANRPQAFPRGSPPAGAVDRPGERVSVAGRPLGCLRLPRCPVAPVPASAQTEIWSATLTVEVTTALPISVGYGEGFFGALSDTDFVREGATYRVFDIFYYQHGSFIFSLDAGLADTCGLVLELDNLELKFRDAEALGGTTTYGYAWAPSSLGWTDDQTVEVKLVVSDGSPCAPLRG